MSLVKDLRVLLAPALITLPLAAAPAALIVPVEIAVITAWAGLLFCRLFRNKGLILSVLAITALAYVYGQELSKQESYWFYLCLASLSVSLVVYFSTIEPKPMPAPLKSATEPEPLPEVKEDPELIELRKQVQHLVQWQYRAVEVEQALEQERSLHQQNSDNNVQANFKIKDLEHALQESLEKIKAFEEATKTVDEKNDKYEKLQQDHQKLLEQQAALNAEYSDLKTCFEHLNTELRLAEENNKQQCQTKEEEGEKVEAPLDLLTAWQEADREYRRYRGLHTQLRTQFDEQTQALEEARKERFNAIEQLNNENIRWKEHQWEDAQTHLEHTAKLLSELTAKEEEVLALEGLLARARL